VSGFHLRLAASHVWRGGVVAYPTEAVYGLGCDPLDAAAFERLLKLKGRSAAKGVILIADSVARIESWVAPLTAREWDRMGESWPGPVTWIVPASTHLPPWLTGGRPTIAVRIPGHQLARDLCAACRSPLVSTSANHAGRTAARSALRVRQLFRDPALMILDGEVGQEKAPSVIKDLRTGKILRG